MMEKSTKVIQNCNLIDGSRLVIRAEISSARSPAPGKVITLPKVRIALEATRALAAGQILKVRRIRTLTTAAESLTPYKT